jgi:hypothetical protein
MRKFFLLVCILLVAVLAVAQTAYYGYANTETRWGLQPGGVVMSPPPPYPVLMTTPSIALDNGMMRPAVPVVIMMSPAPVSTATSAAAPRMLSLGAATFSTAYDLSGRHDDLAKIATELKQNRAMHSARTYTNADIANLKPPKPLKH